MFTHMTLPLKIWLHIMNNYWNDNAQVSLQRSSDQLWNQCHIGVLHSTNLEAILHDTGHILHDFWHVNAYKYIFVNFAEWDRALSCIKMFLKAFGFYLNYVCMYYKKISLALTINPSLYQLCSHHETSRHCCLVEICEGCQPQKAPCLCNICPVQWE